MASQKFKSKIQADAGVQITGTSGSKALQLDASGNIQESTVTTAELAQLAGVSSAVVTVDGTQTLTNKTLTAPAISSPTGLVKADVGLSNVDNTSDATKNAATATLTNKTLTAPVINSPTGIVKGDVGLGNVDNTSDATKDAATATLTNKTLTSPVINSPTGIVKGDVGLGNVDNTSDANKPVSTAQGLADTAIYDAAIQRANHTGTQLAATISDFSSAAKSAAVSDAIVDAVTDVAPSQNAVFDALALKISSSEKGSNNGVATLDAGGKIPAAQLPSTVMEFKGVFDPATATFTDAGGNAGDVYLASAAGSYDAGAGSITYAIGDWAVHNGTEFQKSLNSNAVVSVNSQTGVVVLTKSDVGLGNVDNTSDATKDAAVATLTNKTLTAPVINSPTGIVKGDVGLGNVDNTSDATKNSATATLTNKTIDASSNTISNLTVAMLASGVLDTDLSSVSASDDTIPSAKATRAYIISQVGAGAVAGDISLTSFSASNNQAAAASVTGLAFAAGVTRSFKAQVSVAIDATAGLYEAFELIGIQKASSFEMSVSSVGDDSGIVFSITSAGQVEYTSTNVSGFVSNTIKFRATTTTV